MKLTWGNDYFNARSGAAAAVQFDTAKLINGHVLIVGSSGVGKSHTIRRMISQATEQGKVRFHVFDVHGDLDIEGASVVQFSEQAPFGLNPLHVNPDRDFGGTRKAVQSFISTINQSSSTALGVKQEAVIRNLLLDVYHDFGFYEDDPATWSVNAYDSRLISSGMDNRIYLEVRIEDKDKVKAFGGRWDPAKKLWWVHTQDYKGELTKWKPAYKPRTYPTVADVAERAKSLYQERFLGSDQRAVRALIELNKKTQAYQRKALNAMKHHHFGGSADDEETAALELAKERAITAYTDYANAIRTGVELESLLKYDSADVLKSVMDRLNNLKATGIFKEATPPFDPTLPVWRYKLNALRQEEKKMLVLFTLQEIFYRAVQRGEQSDVVEVVVLDELGTYTSSADDDSGDGIIGVISREARKFGLALWAANQSPANVPESLISSTGTKVILGIDEMYWNSAVAKLRLETKLLDWIRPHKTMAVQMKEKGALKNRWWWVQL